MTIRLDTPHRRWRPRLVARYFLLQLPDLVLVVLILLIVRSWVDLPSWLFWGVIGALVLKEVTLFPFVWRAYEWDGTDRGDSMKGLRGLAVEPLAPSGYIQVRGELWQAEVTGGRLSVEAGQAVLVRGSRGLTLLVDAEDRTSPAAASNKCHAPR
jgi:membrane protein implicated in regulation of membrane protease activity